MTVEVRVILSLGRNVEEQCNVYMQCDQVGARSNKRQNVRIVAKFKTKENNGGVESITFETVLVVTFMT